jgi:hypothetical protein
VYTSIAGPGEDAFFSEGGRRINTGSVWGCDTLILVSGTCYLSNRCSDKLIQHNQSGSNLRLQLFSTLVVEIL